MRKGRRAPTRNEWRSIISMLESPDIETVGLGVSLLYGHKISSYTRSLVYILYGLKDPNNRIKSAFNSYHIEFILNQLKHIAKIL